MTMSEAVHAHRSDSISSGIRRDGKIIDVDAGTALQAGDVVAVSGPTETLVALEQHAKEVADKELLDIPVESVDLVITNKDVNGRTLIDLAKEDFARGVYLQKITRGATSVDVPILAQTTVHRGDILKLSGTKTHIARIEKAIGYADRPSDATDMVWVGLFILVSGLLGALSGEDRRRPRDLVGIGRRTDRRPDAGLAALGAPHLRPPAGSDPVVHELRGPERLYRHRRDLGRSGLRGRPQGQRRGAVSSGGLSPRRCPCCWRRLSANTSSSFDPAINLGCCGGARTSTASVAMVADVAKSNIPMLGYTVPYAVSNTLLTLIGMIIVLIY